MDSLLKATAGLTGRHVAAARAKADESLLAAKANLRAASSRYMLVVGHAPNGVREPTPRRPTNSSSSTLLTSRISTKARG